MAKAEIAEFDIDIDENALNREWVKQPRMYFKCALKAADARKEHDRAKAELDLVKAEVDQSIRSNPEQFGIAKLTEAAVAAAIPLQKEFVAARNRIGELKHLVDVYEAALGALDHRKRALEGLVQLLLAGYFAAPKTPKGCEEQIDEMKKQMVRRGHRRSSDD